MSSLREIARRLQRIPARSIQEAGLLTYPLGAVFCAAEAKRCGFTDRQNHPDRWRTELNDARRAAAALAADARPAAGTWTSIVHFNSALHRIDAGFERLVKCKAGRDARSFDELKDLAAELHIPPATLSLWARVRRGEVNRLKHESGGALAGQRLSYRDMLRALDSLVRELERLA